MLHLHCMIIASQVLSCTAHCWEVDSRFHSQSFGYFNHTHNFSNRLYMTISRFFFLWTKVLLITLHMLNGESPFSVCMCTQTPTRPTASNLTVVSLSLVCFLWLFLNLFMLCICVYVWVFHPLIHPHYCFIFYPCFWMLSFIFTICFK